MFEPAQSLETYQTATNPAPDIAALMSILPRLLNLLRESMDSDGGMLDFMDRLTAAAQAAR